MEIKRLVGVISISILTACHGTGQSSKTVQNTGLTAWKFNFFTPRALPALMTFAVIIDDNQRVSRFVTLNSTPDLSDVTGTITRVPPAVIGTM